MLKVLMYVAVTKVGLFGMTATEERTLDMNNLGQCLNHLDIQEAKFKRQEGVEITRGELGLVIQDNVNQIVYSWRCDEVRE